jgi:RHS repeat-associated protein
MWTESLLSQSYGKAGSPWSSDTVTNTYNNRLRTALSLAQPTGVWTNGFGYDAARRLTSVTSPAGSFTYLLPDTRPSTLVTRLSLPKSSYITNTYDTVARLTGTYLKNSTNGTLNSHAYAYNMGNQRTRQTFTDASTYDYYYDGIGQLTNADSSVAAQDRGYVYDAAWNLNYRTNNTTLNTFKADTKNQLTNATPVGTQTYDSNGNVTYSAGTSQGYAYDDENELIDWYYYDGGYNGNGSPTSPADLRTELVYDGRGRLRKRVDYVASGSAWSVSSETRYVYDGMRVIQERNGSNTPLVSYTRGSDLSGSLEGAGGIGGLLARSHGYSAGNWTNHNCYQADGNGNVTYLVSSSQGLAASYKYDPYGNLISSSGTLAAANVYRFSSKEWQVNSGLVYYGYRWYSPSVQRWPNRDPLGELGFEVLRSGQADLLGDGPNLYAYVKNNPVDRIDQLGLDGEATLAAEPTLLMDEEALAAYRAKCARCAAYAAAVQAPKAGVAMGGCKSGDSCAVLAPKNTAWLTLAITRSRLNKVCFGGGDATHQQKEAEAWSNVGKCGKYLAAKGCIKW